MLNQSRACRGGSSLLSGGFKKTRLHQRNMINSFLLPAAVNFQSIKRFESTKIEAEVSSYYDKAAHYRKIWGENIHIGYYNSVDNPSLPACDWNEAQTRLTSRMGRMIDVDDQSNVLDLGCGFGQPAVDLAKEFGCRVVGIDISSENINVCNQILNEIGDDRINELCQFEVGSFMNLKENVTRFAPFSHVFTIEAIYHVASHFDTVLSNVSSVMDHSGLFINCDFLRTDSGATEKVQNHFYDRLKLDYLVSPTEMMQSLTNNNFDMIKCEDWSDHAVIGYTQLMEKAQENGEVELATHYEQTWKAFQRRELLMACVIARKM